MTPRIRIEQANGWGEYQKLVLAELERLDESIDKINARIDNVRDDEIQKLREEVANLKVRASVLGLLAGAVPGAAAAAMQLLQKLRP